MWLEVRFQLLTRVIGSVSYPRDLRTDEAGHLSTRSQHIASLDLFLVTEIPRDNPAEVGGGDPPPLLGTGLVLGSTMPME